MIEISVLCPTRRRPELLRRSYNSLLSLADNPDQLELLTAVDPDDNGMDGEVWQPYDIDQTVWWTAPERYGYQRLHEYYNALASRARGRWCLIWNDDAFMQTAGWDSRIVEQPPNRLLWPYANSHSTGNLFPIWPRSWSDAMGHVSLSLNVDRWLSEIARSKGIEVRVQLSVYHERADITGMNMDQTYEEGRKLQGHDSDDPWFHSEEAQMARSRDANTVEDLVYGPSPR